MSWPFFSWCVSVIRRAFRRNVIKPIQKAVEEVSPVKIVRQKKPKPLRPLFGEPTKPFYQTLNDWRANRAVRRAAVNRASRKAWRKP